MNFDYLWILKTIPAAIIGLTLHEYAHAFTAYKLGDSTAKDQGRLTLNPLKHLDPVGFILIVMAGFGWAKPVHFSPEQLKHKHRDEILIALAGPFSNFCLALVFLVLARLLFVFSFFNSTEAGFGIVNLLVLWAVVNFGLFLFNLLPIPPLDGSHIYMTFLKGVSPLLMQRIYQFGTLGLLAIILLQNYAKIEIFPLGPLINSLTMFFINTLGFN